MPAAEEPQEVLRRRQAQDAADAAGIGEACRASGAETTRGADRSGILERPPGPGRRILRVNLLFAAGLAFALPWLAAGALAHRWGGAAGTPWSSHHAYAVRTFWIGIAGVVGAVLASPAGVMEPLLVLTWAYCAARVGRGFWFRERADRVSDPGRFF